jgi:RimJ/RimL family protein N-acetyltransferase
MIYGERIRLRAAERGDIPTFVAWLNDPDVRQFLFLNLPLSVTEEEQWFETMQKTPPAEHVLVIEIKIEDGWKAIGNTSFMGIDWLNRLAEIGIFIGEKSFWNQGYGRDTMLLMQKHGFETLNLNRIWLRVYEPNVRGIHAYENAGFQHEGKLRQAIFKDGRYYDVLLMSVLRKEWLERKPQID